MVRKKLLLHICCGSCAVYVFEKLKKDYEVTGFFYNPNIQPFKEYESRKKELERAAKIKNWDVVYNEHDMNNWFQQVKGYEKEPEKGKRCSICFYMRLKKTFEYAKSGWHPQPEMPPHRLTRFEAAKKFVFFKRFCKVLPKSNGFDIVATTLSISPYKVTKQINQEGEKLAREFGIEFLPENFKKQNGYNTGRKMAQELGVKHQNYCGCVFSKVEKKLKRIF